MRTQWIVSILSILVSMGLLMIIMGQYQVMLMLQKGDEKLKRDALRLDDLYANEDLLKTAMEKLVLQGQEASKKLQASVEILSPEMEKKKTESLACQTEKKKIEDELASAEKVKNDTAASSKTQTDAWAQEVNALKEQLNGYREICDHVKQDPAALKLCGPKPS